MAAFRDCLSGWWFPDGINTTNARSGYSDVSTQRRAQRKAFLERDQARIEELSSRWQRMEQHLDATIIGSESPQAKAIEAEISIWSGLSNLWDL